MLLIAPIGPNTSVRNRLIMPRIIETLGAFLVFLAGGAYGSGGLNVAG